MKSFKKGLLMMGLALGLVNMPAKADYKNAIVPLCFAGYAAYLAKNDDSNKMFNSCAAIGLSCLAIYLAAKKS